MSGKAIEQGGREGAEDMRAEGEAPAYAFLFILFKMSAFKMDSMGEVR
jgi:hypothetical protein